MSERTVLARVVKVVRQMERVDAQAREQGRDRVRVRSVRDALIDEFGADWREAELVEMASVVR